MTSCLVCQYVFNEFINDNFNFEFLNDINVFSITTLKSAILFQQKLQLHQFHLYYHHRSYHMDSMLLVIQSYYQ